jgi:hypothetical protein
VFSPTRALHYSAQSAEPLPFIPELNALYGLGVKLRRGELVMWAGRSGSAKSSFALWLAMKWALPTLYFSADMSPWQASVRLAAAQQGKTITEIEGELSEGTFVPGEALPIQFAFDSSPTLDDMEDELDAYVEAWGRWPELIFVDNLRNVDAMHDNEYGGQNFVLDWMHGITRKTGAGLHVLHHTQLAVNTREPFAPQPRWAIKNKVDELPETILTLGLDPESNVFQIACTKQRMGEAGHRGEEQGQPPG